MTLLLGGSAIAHPFASGSGSQLDPYMISTPQQLDSVRLYCGNSIYATTYFALLNDIDLYDYIRPPNTQGRYGGAGFDDGKGWHPIGTYLAPFSSYFYGNGKRITGLWIKRPTEDNVGLFGYTYSAHIENVGVEVVGWGSVEGRNNVGALIGQMYSGETKKCYATGYEVKGSSSVGGLVGYNHSGAAIKESYAGINVRGRYVVGGLTGRTNGSPIQECYAVGNYIEASGDTVGGLVGYAIGSTTIKICYAASRNITAVNTTKGGLVGMLRAACSVENSYFNKQNLLSLPSTSQTEIYSTGRTESGGSSSGINSRTIDQLAARSNYAAAFDFNNVWSICDGHSYPYFKWQKGLPAVFEVGSDGRLSFAPLVPADSMDIYYARIASVPEETLWTMCDSRNCTPPYQPYRALNTWYFEGTPGLGVYYQVAMRYAGCALPPSYPAKWLSRQRPEATVNVRQALSAAGINSDTIQYGTILPPNLPIITNPPVAVGDVMKANFVLYCINGTLPDYANPIAYTATLDAGRYVVSIDTMQVSVYDRGGVDVGKYYTLPPRRITTGILTVVPKPGEIHINMSNYPGWGAPSPQNTNNSGGSVDYWYKRCGQSDATYTTTLPNSRGCYTIRAVLSATTNYTAAWDTLSFNIGSMLELEVYQKDGYERCLDPPTVIFNAYPQQPVLFLYAPQGSTYFVPTPPTAVGNYQLYAAVARPGDGMTVSHTYNFKIDPKGMSMLVFAQYDTIYGNPLPPKLVIVNTSRANINYYYKPRAASDVAYDMAVPTEAGEYRVKGIAQEICAYQSAEYEVDFTIKKAAGVLVIVQDTGIYGHLPPPRIVQQNSPGNVTISYKERSESDAAYRPAIAPEVGLYTMRAVMDATNNYSAAIVILNFVIVKAPGSIIFVQNDGYFNSPLPPPVLLGTNSGGSVSYLYKSANVPDEYFTERMPSNAGYYIIRGIVEATNNYTRGISDIFFEVIDTICDRQSVIIALNYWEKLLLANININTNGGYNLAQSAYFRWTRNAVDIGVTKIPYKYLDHYPQTGDRYMVYTTTASGDTIHSCIVIGGLSTSAPSGESAKQAWVYPNPAAASGEPLAVLTQDDDSSVEIYDLHGTLVRQYDSAGYLTYITIRGLPAGIYIVRHGRRSAAVAVY